MIVLFPIVADAGLKFPVAALAIPVPLQVPPAGVPVSETGAALAQKGPAEVIAGGDAGFTVIFCVMVALHAPHVTTKLTG